MRQALIVIWLIIVLPSLVFAGGFLASLALNRALNAMARGPSDDEMSGRSSADN
jgi:hypothetical protein